MMLSLILLAMQADVGGVAAGVPTPPVVRGSLNDWISPNDYPPRALREGAQGVTSFRLTVGVDGRVSACEILTSSGDSDLDETACRVVSLRARFTPARNTQGQVATGTYTNSIKWSIPKENPAPVESVSVVSFTVGPSGAISNCVIEQGVDPACPVGGYATAYTDGQGHYVARRVRITHKVEVLP